MNPRNLCHRIVSSMLTLGMVCILAGLGAHSVSAQSITATTPFPFCVNNQPYPMGSYRFTLLSEWILSIRNMKDGGQSLFPVHPEVGGPQRRVASADGVTFRNYQGLRELKDVHVAGSALTFELIGQGISTDKSRTGGPLEPKSCFT